RAEPCALRASQEDREACRGAASRKLDRLWSRPNRHLESAIRNIGNRKAKNSIHPSRVDARGSIAHSSTVNWTPHVAETPNSQRVGRLPQSASSDSQNARPPGSTAEDSVPPNRRDSGKQSRYYQFALSEGSVLQEYP